MAEDRKGTQLKQLNRLSHALRQFGLTDVFELAELIDGGSLPTKAMIQRRLQRQSERLPAGIGVSDLAERIRAEIARERPRVLDSSEEKLLFDAPLRPLVEHDLVDLKKTPQGAKAAAAYQKRVARIVGTVYHGELVDGKIEVEITGGRRRVDIVFRNAADDGFFAELHQERQIHAPRIWLECKNYKSAIGNPEIDQLAGRLTKDRGMFGILACRSTDDQKLLSARATDIWHSDKKAIIVLTDDDLVELGRASIEGNRLAADAVLRRRLDERIHG